MEERGFKKFLNSHSAIFLAAIFVIVCTIGYFARISLTLKRIDEVKLNIKDLVDIRKQQLLKVISRVKENNEYFENLGELEKARYYTALPEKKNIPIIYTQLDALSKENGVKIEGIDIAEVKKKAASGRGEEAKAEVVAVSGPEQAAIGLKIGVQDYSRAKSFIKGLETHLHLMDIVSLAFNPKEKSMSLNVRSYYLLSLPTE